MPFNMSIAGAGMKSEEREESVVTPLDDEATGLYEQELEEWIEAAYNELLSAPQVPLEVRSHLLRLYLSRAEFFE